VEKRAKYFAFTSMPKVLYRLSEMSRSSFTGLFFQRQSYSIPIQCRERKTAAHRSSKRNKIG